MSSQQSPAHHAALDAEYEIIRELGRGGTALVYLAKERSSGAEVAIKVIRARYVEDEEAMARFAREARFVAQLHHENIVPVRAVLDLGSAGIAIIMEHVAGRTLRQVIRADGRLSPTRAEEIVRDIGRALGAAHAMGIVHRDVKPENIFIDSNGRALLADFGLARSMTADTQLTMSGVAIGTPAYMAPEQIEGVELDARADVYSLGLVAWEMLTGNRPWDGQSLYAVLYHQKHELLPDVRDLRDDVPDRLAEVIVRAIEKDPAARWPTMRALLNGLDDATPLRFSVRRTPGTTETTRFVRPPTPTSAVAFAPTAQRLLEIANELEGVVANPSSGGYPATQQDTWLSAQRRRTTFAVGTAAILAAAVVVALVATVISSRSSDVSARTQDRTIPPTIISDAAKPVNLGAPIDSLGVARRDSHPPVTTPSPRVAAPTAQVAAATPRDTAPRPRAAEPPAAAPRLPAFNPRISGRFIGSDTPAAIRAPTDRAPTASVASTPPVAATPLTSSVSIVAGGTHSCFTDADGRVLCWGNNDRGQLGSAGASRTAAPLIAGSDVRFTTIAAGLSHTCGITRGGAAWCWGNNDRGQLGDRTVAQRPGPVRAAGEHAFRGIAAGAAHTCGLDPYGVAWCWGANTNGQLGDNNTRDSAIPVVAGLGTIRFVAISAGWNFTCGVATNGLAQCWGENSGGQIGDGTIADRSGPTAVGGEIRFASIAAGSAHACGLTSQGEAYCWGRNSNGQLGDGTTVDRTSPVRVRGAARFAAITAGAVHTCALSTEGSGYCWGRNTYGQLGNGTNTDETQPTSIAGSNTFASVRAFGSHTCGATVLGQALCWGYNLEGQLGDGTRIHRMRPVLVDTPSGGR